MEYAAYIAVSLVGLTTTCEDPDVIRVRCHLCKFSDQLLDYESLVEFALLVELIRQQRLAAIFLDSMTC